jgi:hypothetical protein
MQSLNHTVYVKLATENYLVWRTQAVPYLEGNSLFSYVTGEIPGPHQFIPTPTTKASASTSALVPNPAYMVWFHQDKLILSAIISTLTEGVLAHAVGISTSHELWVLLEKMFASQSQARMIM